VDGVEEGHLEAEADSDEGEAGVRQEEEDSAVDVEAAVDLAVDVEEEDSAAGAEVHREGVVVDSVEVVGAVVVSAVHDLYVCIVVLYSISSCFLRYLVCDRSKLSWSQSFDFSRNRCKSGGSLVLCCDILLQLLSYRECLLSNRLDLRILLIRQVLM